MLPGQSVIECSPAWKVKSITETIAAPWKHAVMKRTCAAPQGPGGKGALVASSATRGGLVSLRVLRLG